MTQTATKERPIIFSAPMVRAILEGRKTQTRRKCRHQPFQSEHDDDLWLMAHGHGKYSSNQRGERIEKNGKQVSERWWKEPVATAFIDRCPYGVPGDHLWVREAFSPCACDACLKAWPNQPDPESIKQPPHHVNYRATYVGHSGISWRPSIHMPRWASRITLEVVSVRVERLQSISAADILAEGVVERSHNVEAFAMVGSNPKCPVSAFDGMCYPDLRSLWQAGWTKINGPGSWDSDPWVWVVEFKRCP